MQTLMVGYDLNKQGKNYGPLIEDIKVLANGHWWHYLTSTWFIKTDLTVAAVRDRLTKQIDGDDELLVMRVTGAAWAGMGFKQEAYNWLKNSL